MQECVGDIVAKAAILRAQNRVSYGNNTAVLISDADPALRRPAEYLLGRMNLLFLVDERKYEIIDKATWHDLESVIQNPEFESVITIGHASYGSWEATDRSVSWLDVGKAVTTHLKSGFWASFGCAEFKMHPVHIGYCALYDVNKFHGRNGQLLHSDEFVQGIDLTVELLTSELGPAARDTAGIEQDFHDCGQPTYSVRRINRHLIVARGL